MKLLIAFALALATASAAVVQPEGLPVPLRDATVFETEGRIVNGRDAAEGQLPYQAGLSLIGPTGNWWCGGSLIGPTWILTAAHCTSSAESVTVYLGSTIRTSPKVHHTVTSSSFIKHRRYNSNHLWNDISLIRIPSTSYSNFIRNVALPKISSSYPTYSGQEVIASGWGSTKDGGTYATKLQYTMMKIIDNSVCRSSYDRLTVISNTICTATNLGHSTCNGDSGGPLVLADSSLLVGVASFVHPKGCSSGEPAGFTRVTSYLNWIQKHTGIAY